MFKVMVFSRRKEGLSRDEFIKRYESGHVSLGGKLVREGKLPKLIDYRRNYIRTEDPANVNVGHGIGFDVITEAWFKDREAFQNRFAHPGADETIKLISRVDSDIFGFKAHVVVDEFNGYGEE